MKDLVMMFILSCLVSCSMVSQHSDSLHLEIKQKEIRINAHEKKLHFEIQIANHTEKNFILLGIRRTFEPLGDDSIVYDSKGASSSLFIKGKSLPDEIDIEISDGKSVTRDSLAKFFNKLRNEYINSSEVLNSGETKTIKMEHEFRIYDLPKGEYQIYLIYSCGDLSNLFGSEEIKKFEKKEKAIAFNGWIKSNEAKLIVE